MIQDVRTPVGEFVATRLGRHEVFDRFGIDYCCGGDAPLAEACRQAGHDPAAVLTALHEADSRAAAAPNTGTAEDWTTASLTRLCDHIESTHHVFMKTSLPRLAGLMEKVLGAHGGNHPHLHEVARVLGELQAEITDHLRKEEQVLFPLIRAMDAADGPVAAHCGTVQNPIRVMEHEHDNAGDALRRLRELNDDYTPPADACPTYQALLAGLVEMEHDLHLHIHKENNILHPRAARLEAQLAGGGAAGRKGHA